MEFEGYKTNKYKNKSKYSQTILSRVLYIIRNNKKKYTLYVYKDKILLSIKQKDRRICWGLSTVNFVNVKYFLMFTIKRKIVKVKIRKKYKYLIK